MELEIPNSYKWFLQEKLIKFIPRHFYETLELKSDINERFKIEDNSNREVLTFGHRQDMDTYAGFEIVNSKICEIVIVFHPSFQKNTADWSIIENEHIDFIQFMKNQVLQDVKEWLEDDFED